MVKTALRLLRWVWLGPLALAMLFDLANGTSVPVSGLRLFLTALALLATVGGVCFTIGLGRLALIATPRLSLAWSVAALILITVSMLPALRGPPGFLSVALAYAAVILVGVRCAHAVGRRDLTVAALIGIATALLATLVGQDWVLLTMLAVTVLVVSAALGLLVREQRRGAATARRLAIDDERRAMAHELHDTVAHELTGILVLAQGARPDPKASRPGASTDLEAGALGLIEQAAQRALDQVRELVETLRAQSEDSTRTPTATGAALVRQLVQAYAESSETEVVADLQPVDLSTAGWLAAQRVCTEALTNIRRHAADATQVRIALFDLGDGEAVALSIADDGRSGHGIGGGTGSGLVGARERIELLGGTFTAGRGADQWWTVCARLPVDASVQRGTNR